MKNIRYCVKCSHLLDEHVIRNFYEDEDWLFSKISGIVLFTCENPECEWYGVVVFRGFENPKRSPQTRKTNQPQ